MNDEILYKSTYVVVWTYFLHTQKHYGQHTKNLP